MKKRLKNLFCIKEKCIADVNETSIPENTGKDESVSEPDDQEKTAVQLTLDEEERLWLRRLFSHNIRMPMTIIAGYGDMLKNGECKNREEELDCIGKICKNIDFLDTLLKVFLDDKSNEELLEEKEWFDLLACGREAFEYVKSITQKANINVSVNSSRANILFYGNRIVLIRAFYNLIENSVRYMKHPGNICVTIEDMQEEILVIYRDDGEGMDENEAEYITHLNYQGSNAGKRGNGIGMYLVRDAVEKSGGTIEIHTGKGKGMGIYITTFPK